MSLPFDPTCIFNTIATGLIVLDAQQQVVAWNSWMSKHSGISTETARCRPLRESFTEVTGSRIDAAIQNALRYRMSSLISPSLHRPILKVYQTEKDRPHDRRMQQLIHITPMDVDGSVGCLLQIQDMTATVRREKRLRMHADQLREQSYRDQVTGVWNRRKFDETIREEFNRAQRTGSHISILIAEFDAYKPYLELYGQGMADETLIRLAQVCRDTLRHSGDAVCRYSREAFGIVLPGTNEAGASHVAERLRLAVETLLIRHDQSRASKSVTLSLGVGCLSKTVGQDVQSVVHAADMALYQAKMDGGNRGVVFSLDTGIIRACS